MKKIISLSLMLLIAETVHACGDTWLKNYLRNRLEHMGNEEHELFLLKQILPDSPFIITQWENMHDRRMYWMWYYQTLFEPYYGYTKPIEKYRQLRRRQQQMILNREYIVLEVKESYTRTSKHIADE